MENSSKVIQAIKAHFLASSKQSFKTVALLTNGVTFALLILDDPSFLQKGPMAVLSILLVSGLVGLFISCGGFFAANAVKTFHFLIIKNKLQKNEHLKDSNRAKVRTHPNVLMKLYKFIFKLEVIQVVEMNGKTLSSPHNAWVAYDRPSKCKKGRIIKTPIGNFFLPETGDDTSILEKAS